jgi:hypothetical protein
MNDETDCLMKYADVAIVIGSSCTTLIQYEDNEKILIFHSFNSKVYFYIEHFFAGLLQLTVQVPVSIICVSTSVEA